MLPKINFAYSLPYNILFNENDEMEISKEVNQFIDKLKSRWNEIEEEILKSIEEIGFPWKINRIPCFVVKNFPVAGISMPLTIRTFNNTDFAVYILTHELIHLNLFREKKYVGILNLLQSKIKQKPIVVRHIIVYSVLRRVITKVFGEEFFNKMYNIEKEKTKNSEHKKAMENFEGIYPKLKEGNVIEALEEYLK